MSEDSFADIDETARAKRTLSKRYHSSSSLTDAFYASVLCLRSVPVPKFLDSAPAAWALPITSINEDRLLEELGLKRSERDQIEGLQVDLTTTAGQHGGFAMTEELSSRAIRRLAANPPAEVGRMQRRTAERLLRPYPLGLRFSGNNMSPLPGWLAGAQSVALNMSNNDLPVQLHFALFNGSSGYVLKPPEMRSTPSVAGSAPSVEGSAVASSGQSSLEGIDDESYWPPPREVLHRTTIEILSLHHLPKVCSSRLSPTLSFALLRSVIRRPACAATACPPPYNGILRRSARELWRAPAVL